MVCTNRHLNGMEKCYKYTYVWERLQRELSLYQLLEEQREISVLLHKSVGNLIWFKDLCKVFVKEYCLRCGRIMDEMRVFPEVCYEYGTIQALNHNIFHCFSHFF